MPGAMLTCPRCRALGVDGSWAVPSCVACLTPWTNWSEFWAAIGKAGITHTPSAPIVGTPPAAVPFTEPDYIESGEMKREIEKLIERAVAQAVLDTTKEIYDEVRNVGMGKITEAEMYDEVEHLLWSRMVRAKDERNVIG